MSVDTTITTLEAMATPPCVQAQRVSLPAPPTLPATAQQGFLVEDGSDFVVLTHAEPPYALLWASDAWLDMCGFTAGDVLGSDLKCIQGPGTDRSKIAALMKHVRSGAISSQPFTIPNLINYDKNRKPFWHTLTVTHEAARYPGGPSMLRTVSTNVRRTYSTESVASECLWSDEFEDYQNVMQEVADYVFARSSS